MMKDINLLLTESIRSSMFGKFLVVQANERYKFLAFE